MSRSWVQFPVPAVIVENRNIRLTLAYDGTRYLGWQRQRPAGQKEAERTIQGKLEGVLGRLTGGPVNLIGAARTDAGVHALGQVANFHTASRVPLAELSAALERFLPEDIAVLAAEEAGPRFHARYLARGKLYRYRIWNRTHPDVFQRKYALHVPEPLDLAAMERAAGHLPGEHDFSSFAAHLSAGKSPVRRLEAVRVRAPGGAAAGWIDLEFEGDGFLHHMARILAGTLLEAGAGRLDPERVPQILAARRRPEAGPLAPAHGLFLVEVRYGPEADCGRGSAAGGGGGRRAG